MFLLLGVETRLVGDSKKSVWEAQGCARAAWLEESSVKNRYSTFRMRKNWKKGRK